jgi:hypothetical protein
MTTTTIHPLAADYLDRLEHAARRLPRGERRELVEEIGAHLAEAIEPGMSDAEALTVLDQLGDPEEIVDAQLPDSPYDRDRRGVHEWGAIFLLLFGGSCSSWAGSSVSSCYGARAPGIRATS